MLKSSVLLAAVASACVAAMAQADAVVSVGDSTAGWSGFMNVFNLPADGGAFQFASGWGVADLRSSFNDPAHTVTLSPNTIGDPDPYWYIGGGGPGQAGNKIMDANLYIESTGVYSGTLTFEGTVLSNTLTSAHVTTIFIRDFAADYSSFNTTTVVAAPGAFSISLALIADPTRHVQYGFNTIGVNVWETDVAPFGEVVITPAPGALALLGMSGLLVSRRRR